MRRRPRRSRWYLPAALALLAPALLAGWTLTALAAAAPSPAAGDPTKGGQLFGSSGCTACHGSNLEGGIGPKLNPIQNLGNTKNPLDPAYLTTTISNGLQGAGGFATAMPPKGGNPNLSAQDVADIAAFIIQSNASGQAGLGPQDLARSDVFWVSVAIFLMVMVTFVLSRYNMRWIDRRAAARRERERTR